jgi:hypothetical protein
MTTYFINNIAQDIPTGSIIAYYINTNIDPSGWVIMNGISRDNSTGIYNNLLNMNIGSGILNQNYIPPNYNGAFLRGSGNSGIYNGPSINMHQTHATQIHNHTATQAAHTHTHNANGADENGNSTTPRYGFWFSNGFRTAKGFDNSTSELCLDLDRYPATPNTNLVINSSQPSITVDNYNGANETRPYNIGVQWILKL